MITNHRYDSGPEGPGGPCIVGEETPRPFSGSAQCGQPESAHAESEYEDFSGEAEYEKWAAKQHDAWLREQEGEPYAIPFVSDQEHGTRFPQEEQG